MNEFMSGGSDLVRAVDQMSAVCRSVDAITACFPTEVLSRGEPGDLADRIDGVIARMEAVELACESHLGAVTTAPVPRSKIVSDFAELNRILVAVRDLMLDRGVSSIRLPDHPPG